MLCLSNHVRATEKTGYLWFFGGGTDDDGDDDDDDVYYDYLILRCLFRGGMTMMMFISRVNDDGDDVYYG